LVAGQPTGQEPSLGQATLQTSQSGSISQEFGTESGVVSQTYPPTPGIPHQCQQIWQNEGLQGGFSGSMGSEGVVPIPSLVVVVVAVSVVLVVVV